MPTRECSIDGCTSAFYARSFCRSHYSRFRKYGDPLYVGSKKSCVVAGCDQPLKSVGYCVGHLEDLKARPKVRGPLALSPDQRDLIEKARAAFLADTGYAIPIARAGSQVIALREARSQ